MAEKKREKRERSEAAEVMCPKCGKTEIVYIPQEEVPMCPICKRQMVIKELLTEGKSY
ncbi:hypothetical protein [Oceanidesulfovibrio marinus]|uniref:hypothetical protein n=1 Tax=Oceanidesulfovibrio marinus TaxID=370038 RepID=UPI00142EC861|nr:hypothetical protein [Oceanidesulfovibrio marinus]